MDGERFDDLARGVGERRSRRAALRALAGGFLGLGTGAHVAAGAGAAEVAAQACHVKRCKKQVLGQDCTDRRGRPDNHQCCQGLKCHNRRGVCVFQNRRGRAGDFCRKDKDCRRDFYCKKNQCIPEQCRS